MHISLKKKNINVLMLCLLIFSSTLSNLFAQETLVVGQIMNAVDNQPIPSVNIFFKNSTEGVQSNEEGYFMIKTLEKYNTLIFSAIGFKQEQIHLRPGQSIGIQIKMKEENTLLQEVFVIPGANPALELMKKVRIMRSKNDLTQQSAYSAESTEQNLVLLEKVDQQLTGKRIFDQLKNGSISSADSALVVPLYMAESKFQLSQGKKIELSKNIFSSPESADKILEKLVGNLDTELNFYDNSISVFGKNMVSPLANVGFAYYDYYLADSVNAPTGKQYEIHFRTKNAKNLAFFGKMDIDSATLALTSIEAELPVQANINFIRNLRIAEKFELQPSKIWTRQSEDMALNMNYELFADSIYQNSHIYIKRSATYHYSDSISSVSGNFAQSSYSAESLDEKLNELNNTPLLRTAKWIADVIFTSYMNVGKIDIGRVQKIIRITDIEGFRLTLPFRTNENLWKNISLGGSLGYGFKNQIPKYSGFAQFNIPGEKRRILELSYTNDYRRVDYNYNNFLYRENPLISADEDIVSSLFALKSAGKMAERTEYSFSFSNEWTNNIESSMYIRSNKMFSNISMPMQKGLNSYNSMSQQSVTFATRFSFGERKYNDHLQRIYIPNTRPVIYSIMEYGKYQFDNQSGDYGKIALSMRQFYKFDFGKFNYVLDAGMIFGNVPYPLLQIPSGSESGRYSIFQFNMMNYMEYAADKFVNLHSELMFNGIIMNQIPLIKNLNLREICSFNVAYGSLNESHKLQLDYPTYMYSMDKPYMEVGVGFANILRILNLQSVWRLTDLNHPGVSTWGIRACLRLNL